MNPAQNQTDEKNGNCGGYEGGWERLDEELQLEARFPQLIICGHGSVDDPDGTWVRFGFGHAFVFCLYCVASSARMMSHKDR